MSVKTQSIKTPLDLYRILNHLWAADTASPTGSWSAANPAQNHCSVTSLIVQDYFGGEIYTTRTAGGTHFYNAIDGIKWDLTASQFAQPIPYEDTLSTREKAIADTTAEKYRLVVERLDREIDSQAVQTSL